MKPLTKEWIKKAEKDFRVAKREINNAEPPSLNAVCFHAQQCVEKYLKAVLQETEVVFQKIHDLEVLLHQSLSFIPELEF
jgi:HEPN domain-containing protein